MKRLLCAVTGIFLGLGGMGGVSLYGQGAATNYDESKAGSYTLPDPLRLPNGKTARSTRQWERKARPAVLALFAEHVYGRMPSKPKDLHFKVVSEDADALGGKAIRKQITVFFARGDNGPSMDILLYLPKGAAGPVPVFTGLNYCGNHCVSSDPGIALSTRWMRNSADYRTTNNQASDSSRGTHSRRWPVEELVSRGYGLATAYYGDLEPDHEEGWKTGIRTTLQPALNVQPPEWSAIGAWAWGLSRLMDYLETDPAVDARRVAITGHSRLGKAALWAAANDTRFAVVVSNDSGEG
ncbi:MAG: acetylxylan esterase, partial [Cytophagales bacterium]|nr:acetylxylan esterase [Cytophagales bacterium]